MSLLAIDFGGTRTRAAWYDTALQQIKRDEIPSHVENGQEKTLGRIIDLARSVIPSGAKPAAIGVAAPGPLDPRKGIISHAETLPGWKDVPLADTLCRAFDGTPTWIENDANLAALAEYRLGAGQGADPTLYLTISTGIGGGAIIGGRLFTGGNGLAIEPGHMRFALPDGKVYRLEELASGTALGFWGRRRLTDSDQPSILREASVVNGKTVGEAAKQGDPLALDVVQQAGAWLGIGIANLLHLFNPQAVVLGGSVTYLGDLLLTPVKQTLQENLLDPAFYHEGLIRYAALGEDVCLVGAALYAAQRLGQVLSYEG